MTHRLSRAQMVGFAGFADQPSPTGLSADQHLFTTPWAPGYLCVSLAVEHTFGTVRNVPQGKLATTQDSFAGKRTSPDIRVLTIRELKETSVRSYGNCMFMFLFRDPG